MNKNQTYYDMYYFFHLDGVPDDDLAVEMNYLAEQANLDMPKARVHISMHDAPLFYDP